MALRIGQPPGIGQSPTLAQEQMLPMVQPENAAAPPPDLEDPREEHAKITPEAARYFGSEYRCNSCVHFLQGKSELGSCEIVAGPIDPMGVCSIFTPDEDVLSGLGDQETELVGSHDDAPDNPSEPIEDEGI